MDPRRIAPHDALVRATFSQPVHAKGFLRTALPPAISARIDLTKLSLRAGTFVDRALRGRHTDLLFSARLSEKEALVYVLFEHQSRVDPRMAFRLLVYMARIWERHGRDHPKARKLPAIVPVVLHHSPRGWSASTTFEGLLDVDEETLRALGEHVVRFRFVLDDISHATDRTLRGRAMSALGKLVLWCLRHGRDPDELIRRLRRWRSVIDEVMAAPDGAEALHVVWRYILLADVGHPAEETMARLVEAVGKKRKKRVLSAGEQLIERGIVQGIAQGERKILLALLRSRFGELSAAVTARVDAAEPKDIERWAERVLTAATLDEVFAAS